MAARLDLRGGKLPFIWNVSNKVGPNADLPNNPTDVELMKVLLVMALRAPRVAKFGINGKSIDVTRDPVFDTTLGFWIFRFQQLGAHPTQDGVASPARGVTYAPGTPWVIFSFNEFARESDPELWEALSRNNSLSAALRAELSG
jgi:hypothetical protein